MQVHTYYIFLGWRGQRMKCRNNHECIPCTNLDRFGTAADVSGSLLAATQVLLLVTIIKLRASA
jgi:hypothetical protein